MGSNRTGGKARRPCYQLRPQPFREGVFDPRRMVDWLSDSIDDAVSSGFEGLCATGDMRWELGDRWKLRVSA
jgi:hypothetical protein